MKLLNLEFWSISVCYELIAIAINNRKGPSEWTFDIPKIENVNIQIGSFQFSWNFIWNSFHCLTHLLNSSSIVYSLHQDITDDQTIRVATMVTSLNSIRTKVQRALIEDSIISVLEFEDFFYYRFDVSFDWFFRSRIYFSSFGYHSIDESKILLHWCWWLQIGDFGTVAPDDAVTKMIFVVTTALVTDVRCWWQIFSIEKSHQHNDSATNHYLDIRCWRKNVLSTSLRFWWPIQYTEKSQISRKKSPT